MKVGDIRKHIEAFNRHYAIEGYSKLKKAALISAVLSAQTRLGGAKKTKKKVKLVIVEEPKKASPVAKKASPVAKKASPVAKKASGSKLTSNRQLVQALLDGAIHLLDFGQINEGLEQNWNRTGTVGGLSIGDRRELLKRFQDSPTLSKKLLAFDFHRVGRVRGKEGRQKIPLNLYKEINKNMELREEKLRSNLGRDTATGKLKTIETSTRPKAVRELKEYLALPLWKKVEDGATRYYWGYDIKTGKLLYNAMEELSKPSPVAEKSPLTLDETEDLQNFETKFLALEHLNNSNRPYGTYDNREVADQMKRSFKAYQDFRKTAPAKSVLKFMKSKLSKLGLPLNRVDKAVPGYAKTMYDNIRFQFRRGESNYKDDVRNNEPIIYRGELQDYMKAILRAADKIVGN